MKILIPTSSYPLPGHAGWAPFLKDTFLALAAEGHEIQILVFSPENTLLEYSEGPGVRVRAYPFLPWRNSRLHRFPGLMPSLKKNLLAWLELPFYFFASAYQIMRAISREPFDILHAPWYLPMGFIAVLLKPFHRKPVVITALGGDFHLPKYFAPLLRFTHRHAEANVACSDYLAQAASVYGLPRKSFTVIANGIDTHRFSVKHEQGAKPSRVVVGCAKRLVPEKNISDLIHAVSKLPHPILPGICVKIAGAGPERPVLEGLISKLGLSQIITLEGFISPENMPEFLRSVAIFVDPSTQEGLATSNLEALASGCVLVAANTAGNPEIIVSNDSGFLYPPRDVSALAKILSLLISSPGLRERAALCGQDRVRSAFDVSHTAKKLTALYQNLPSFKKPAAASHKHFAASPAA